MEITKSKEKAELISKSFIFCWCQINTPSSSHLEEKLKIIDEIEKNTIRFDNIAKGIETMQLLNQKETLKSELKLFNESSNFTTSIGSPLIRATNERGHGN